MNNFGFGKTIILGEHFVVHGLPALAAALSLKTIASIQPNDSDDLIFIDNRPKAPGFVPNKSAEYRQMLDNILNVLKINHKNFTITVNGDLPVTCGGIGSSAACAVAIIKAFNLYLNLGLNKSQIDEAALFAESAVHGQPSGIDNTAANLGGVFEFSKMAGMKPVKLIGHIKIVLVDSGKQTDTKRLVLKVKNFLDNKPESAVEFFGHYKQIFDKGCLALKNNNLQALGWCMNENHKLLQQMGVSISELDSIVNTALKSGALGAKLTGTGGGGLVLILTSDETQDKIAQIFERNGYFTIKSEL